MIIDIPETRDGTELGKRGGVVGAGWGMMASTVNRMARLEEKRELDRWDKLFAVTPRSPSGSP